MTAAPLHDPRRDPAGLPTRRPADPTDPAERMADWGLLTQVLTALIGDDELERCPGALVVHADGSLECLEAVDCPTDPALHHVTMPCVEALDGCC
jgi:hypothetical protein